MVSGSKLKGDGKDFSKLMNSILRVGWRGRQLARVLLISRRGGVRGVVDPLGEYWKER